MKRLGKFTGTVYPEDYDFSKCPECCTLIDDEIAEDEEAVTQHHLKDLVSCISCFGCPAAQTSKI